MGRNGSSQKMIMLRKIEGRRKRGRPNMTRIYVIVEVRGISVQLSRAVENRTLCTTLSHGVVRRQSKLNSM